MQNQRRVAIENVYPVVNSGDLYIKRVVDEDVNVIADVLSDGHDIIEASLLYKHESERKWNETRMQLLHNDDYSAAFKTIHQGFYSYKVEAWIDYALTWQHGISRKIESDIEVISELQEGIEYLQKLMTKCNAKEKVYVEMLISLFSDKSKYKEAIAAATSDKLQKIFKCYPEKRLKNSSKIYKVYVDRLKARFSTWYEFFPRSSGKKNLHGTFKDCERLLPRIQKMGFDTLYFPPVHPIGEVNRKGKNNTTEALKGDVGSCWGIGSALGGHVSLHPELGTVADFKALITKAKKLGIEIAMDYALQAAPDHPWVTAHPSWFKWRPDGTVQYAENPPKKYQDILPIYFESKDYKDLWDECLHVLEFWIDMGVEIFRVDNPHTKPFFFWNWIISEVKKKNKNVLFLAEAFTRPKIMQQLAKQGFTQSYTYFTWRDTKHELIEYVEELTKTNQREYMHPNFWPNTPDINPFHLQGANESKYIQRYALAATLSSNTGIYGPVFEYMISAAIAGKEEYLNSEKFQVQHYDWTKENKLTQLIAKINALRNEHEALQQTNNIKFCNIENDKLLAFYKWNDTKTDELLVIVNLDDRDTQQGLVQLPMYELGIHKGHKIEVYDLVTDSSYEWKDEWNFVELQAAIPFHIFKINK